MPERAKANIRYAKDKTYLKRAFILNRDLQLSGGANGQAYGTSLHLLNYKWTNLYHFNDNMVIS